ncbi:hypothetical protein AB0M28_35235 [Streptomyces sp. NPDC051940]|uniref:hypothetical protein n=1 Tax=Streptomyces sp. NPDC051940 TaxID=3155675 RepID=UPI003432EF40
MRLLGAASVAALALAALSASPAPAAQPTDPAPSCTAASCPSAGGAGYHRVDAYQTRGECCRAGRQGVDSGTWSAYYCIERDSFVTGELPGSSAGQNPDPEDATAPYLTPFRVVQLYAKG